jgi:hypothetical protein
MAHLGHPAPAEPEVNMRNHRHILGLGSDKQRLARQEQALLLLAAQMLRAVTDRR